MCARVCVCVHVCTCARVCVCACAHTCVGACIRTCVCVLVCSCRLFKLLSDVFGEDTVAKTPTGDSMSVTVDPNVAFISTTDLVSHYMYSQTCFNVHPLVRPPRFLAGFVTKWIVNTKFYYINVAFSIWLLQHCSNTNGRNVCMLTCFIYRHPHAP